MIKIATDNGKFKFIKESQVEVLHDFMESPIAFDYNPTNVKTLRDTFTLIDAFMSVLNPASMAWIYYCYDDALRCEKVLLVSQAYAHEMLTNLEKMI